MAISHKNPKDLAQVICKELQKKKQRCPDIEVIKEFFEILFYASLETEEREPIQLQLVYLDPDDPDPDPPDRIVKDRWSFIKLDNPLPYTVSSAVKIARALDPRTSALVVHPTQSGQLRIWGFIDQVNRFHDFIHYESRVGPQMPGLFQAVALNIGHIVAYISYQKVAELRINKLITRSKDVLRLGTVRKSLEPAMDKYLRSIRNLVESYIFEDRDHWTRSLEDYWVATLCRLLLRTKSLTHGGAFLITPDDSLDGLRAKYQIRYDRLQRALINRGVFMIRSTYADDHIFDLIDHDADDIPIHLYRDKVVDESELSDIESEIDGSIWFISLLSRVDGLVLMNPDLCARGFGVEIRPTNSIEEVYRAPGPMPASGSKSRVYLEQFATRHRSMKRY